MTPETLELLEQAKAALYKAEQAVRTEEGAYRNLPMLRMRIGLSDIIEHYKEGHKICDLVTSAEYTIHAYLKQFKYL